jgi:hypothetical protein
MELFACRQKGDGMKSGVLALDTILSATFHFSVKWSRDLQSNRARDVLRFIVCRLWDQGRGNLMAAHLTLAQTTVAKKMGLSRQWVGQLVHRLEGAGWLTCDSPKLLDGTNGSTIWRIGRTLKRLLVMLAKSPRGKSPTKPPAKSRWHFSPSKEKKERLSILEKEKILPTPSLIARIPLLGAWLTRGKEQVET